MQLISEVRAQEAQGQTPQDEFSITGFVPLILIFVVFYFLIIRPQSKKAKEHQNLISQLKIGNKVITNSGIVGKITDVNEKEGLFELEIADGVKIKILKNFVSELSEKKAEKKTGKKEVKSKK